MTVAIAHRGDPVGHLENTLDAFKNEIMIGAGMIELDCRLTRDGHVVVLHDSTLTRLWGVPQPVIEVEWDDVRAIRRGHSRIPDLAEVLAAVEVPIMVDVPSVEVIEASLVVVQSARAMERRVFAGNTDALRRLRQLAPSARIALTWEDAEPLGLNCWRKSNPSRSTRTGGSPPLSLSTRCMGPG